MALALAATCLAISLAVGWLRQEFSLCVAEHDKMGSLLQCADLHVSTKAQEAGLGHQMRPTLSLGESRMLCRLQAASCC